MALDAQRLQEMLKKAIEATIGHGHGMRYNGQSLTAKDYATAAVQRQFAEKWLEPVIYEMADTAVTGVVDILTKSDDRHMAHMVNELATQDPNAAKIYIFGLVVHFVNGYSGARLAKLRAATNYKYPLMEAVVAVIETLDDEILPTDNSGDGSTAPNFNESYSLMTGQDSKNTTICGDGILCAMAGIPGVKDLFWASADAYVQGSAAYGIAHRSGAINPGSGKAMLLIDFNKMSKLFPTGKAGHIVSWIHTYNLLMIGGRNQEGKNLRNNRSKIRMLHKEMGTVEEAKEAIKAMDGRKLDEALGAEGYPVVSTALNPYDSIPYSKSAQMVESPPGFSDTTTAGGWSKDNTSELAASSLTRARPGKRPTAANRPGGGATRGAATTTPKKSLVRLKLEISAVKAGLDASDYEYMNDEELEEFLTLSGTS